MYNVLYEPWLHVVSPDGSQHAVGIRDCLVNAHTYKCIADNRNLAILRRLQQRLLETFIIDIYGNSLDTIAKLAKTGHFDADTIDEYLQMCETEGTSFDLFDKYHPFLQTNSETATRMFKPDQASISVATINPRMSSGNNKVFFNHVTPDDYVRNTGAADMRDSYYDSIYRKIAPENANVVTFEEYLNLLLIRHCIAGQGGQGYRSGLMCVGSPPIMYQLSGKNETLFSSILLNIPIPIAEDSTNNGIPMWRWSSYDYGRNLIMNADTINIPLLTGMFFPVMNIYPDLSSINTEKKTISQIYKTKLFQSDDNGLIPAAREFWLRNCEPSVATVQIKKDESHAYTSGVRYTSANRTWMNIRAYADVYQGSAPKVLSSYNEQYEELEDFYDTLGRVSMTAYYIAMDKSSYLTQGMFECLLPECILNSADAQSVSTRFVDAAETTGKALLKNIQSLHKQIYSADPSEKNNHRVQTVEDVIYNRYIRYCESVYKQEFIPKLTNISDINSMKVLLDVYVKKIHLYAWRQIHSIPIPQGASIRTEIAYSKIRTKGKEKCQKKCPKLNMKKYPKCLKK